MALKRTKIARLPKAPLAEVVFELRWKLPGPADAPVALKSDPGLLPLMEAFTAKIKKQGFARFKDMAPPLQAAGYGIVRRYTKAPDQPFPIMQIGHGIFATNESSQYEWTAFKKQIGIGLRALLDGYPKLGVIGLEPIHMEIRYIDVFDKSLLGRASLFDFIKRGTSMSFDQPKFFSNPTIFSGEPAGRIVINRELKGWKNNKFTMDLGSGKKHGIEDIVRLETKVTCEYAGVPTFNTTAKFIKDVDKWLTFAHGITSPFFKAFVVQQVMQKFEEA